MTQFVYSGKILFVDITAYWCVTCKYYKIVALDSIRTLDHFQDMFQIELNLTRTNTHGKIKYFSVPKNRYVVALELVFLG